MPRPRWSMKKDRFYIREDGSKAWIVTVLPSDWRLTPNATRERTLFQAATPAAQKAEIQRKRKAKWKRRQRKKR